MKLEKKIMNVPVYEVDDFIQYNEGMGENWFGTITEVWQSAVLVSAYKSGHEVHVTKSDIIGISTPVKADEYCRIRSGGS